MTDDEREARVDLAACYRGVKLNHVPHKGFAPALPDVVTGRTPLLMADWHRSRRR